MRKRDQILAEFNLNPSGPEGYPTYSAHENNLFLVLEALLDVRDLLAAAERRALDADRVSLKRAAGG